MLPDIKLLETIIRDVARQEILPRFNQIGYELKSDGSLITEADLSADRAIRKQLMEHYPHIAYMSEEMPAHEQTALLNEEPEIWCLDPLDGTSNFAAGVPLFATSLCLIREGQVVLALTYDVNRDEMFTAVKGEGAYLNGKRLKCHVEATELSACVALADYKRLPTALALDLIEFSPFRSQRNLGSSVLEWAWIAASRGQIYLHGGIKLWDCAAGSLILSEAGGHACTLEGGIVFELNVGMRSVVASPDKGLFDKWFNYLHNKLN